MARRTRIDLATFDDTLAVARNMREWDAREIYALREADPGQLARDAAATTVSLNVFVNDDPVANMGGQEVSPGRWQVHMFATPDFRRCSLFTTRYVVRQLIPTASQDGAWSAFCWSMQGHDEAHAWLRALGAKNVGEAALGRAGETFLLFEWPTNVFTQRQS